MHLKILMEAVQYGWKRKVTEKLRRSEWKKKGGAPFKHVTPLGHTFYLYPDQYIDRHIFIYGAYESRFLEIIQRVFGGANAVMLDVGANIGNHAIILGQTFKRIVCFEPSPQIADRLKANIYANGLSNIDVHIVGLSNRNALLPFRLDQAGNLGASRFTSAADKNTIDLRVAQGDEYCARLDLDRLDFIKIDVENHELAVLEGLQETIRRFRPIIAFEFHGAEQSVDHFLAISSVLEGYSFFEAKFAPASLSYFGKFRWQLQHHRGFPEWAKIEIPEPRTYENVVAFPDYETSRQFMTARPTAHE